MGSGAAGGPRRASLPGRELKTGAGGVRPYPAPASAKNRSAGERRPSVSRGRPLSSAATASRSACESTPEWRPPEPGGHGAVRVTLGDSPAASARDTSPRSPALGARAARRRGGRTFATSVPKCRATVRSDPRRPLETAQRVLPCGVAGPADGPARAAGLVASDPAATYGSNPDALADPNRVRSDGRQSLVVLERPGHRARVGAPGERQHEQHPRLLHVEVARADRGRSAAAGADALAHRDTARSSPASRDHDDAPGHRAVERLTLRVGGAPAAVAGDHQTPRAGGDQRVDGGAVGAHVRVDDVDARQLAHPGEIERRRAPRLAVEDDAFGVCDAEVAAVRRGEGVGADRVGLGRVARREDLVVHQEHRAAPAGRRARGDAHRVVQVRRPVGADPVRRTHRAGDHDGADVGDRQVEEVRRFFHRIGAVRDDHAGEVRVCAERVGDAARERQPHRGRDRARGDVGELLGAHGGERVELRHRAEQPAHRDLARLARVVVRRRDGAAGCDDVDARAGGLGVGGRGDE